MYRNKCPNAKYMKTFELACILSSVKVKQKKGEQSNTKQNVKPYTTILKFFISNLISIINPQHRTQRQRRSQTRRDPREPWVCVPAPSAASRAEKWS